jgi:hypothetical protein
LTDAIQGTLDGLSFQSYSQILRAEVAIGVTVPKPLSDSMTTALISCIDRDLDLPVTSKEFWSKENAMGGHRFAGIDCVSMVPPGQLRAQPGGWPAPHTPGRRRSSETRVRRALGHRIKDLGRKALTTDTSGRTYMAAELLYILASLEVLNRSSSQN